MEERVIWEQEVDILARKERGLSNTAYNEVEW